MARNKHPEKTVEKIIGVSLQLFSEKGYEKTTIQDIVNALGMSKGAIYHHFKSKEEILDAICYQSYHNNDAILEALERTDINALERLRIIMRIQIENEPKQEVDRLALNIQKNPKIFMISMKETLNPNAQIVERILMESMQDGSIPITEPVLVSQITMLLLNYWIYSPVTSDTLDIMKKKIHFLRDLMDIDQGNFDIIFLNGLYNNVL